MAGNSQSSSSPGTKQTIFLALAIGLAAGGSGGALGFMLGGKVTAPEETSMQAQGSMPTPQTSATETSVAGADVAQQEKDQNHNRENETADAAGSKKQDVSHSTTRPKAISSKLTVRELSPIVTNLAEPANNWIRLQSAIVYNSEELPHPEKILAELTSDITGYLRTVSLSNLEGADGLRRLQEELSERAVIRSNGKIHEFIIETMVVQ